MSQLVAEGCEIDGKVTYWDNGSNRKLMNDAVSPENAC